MWKNSARNIIPLPGHEEGWTKQEDGEFQIEFVAGNLFPQAILELSAETVETNEESDRETNYDSDFSIQSYDDHWLDI